MKKTIIIFGALSVIILLLFQLDKWSLFSIGKTGDHNRPAFGLVFILVGIIIGILLIRHSKKKKSNTLTPV